MLQLWPGTPGCRGLFLDQPGERPADRQVDRLREESKPQTNRGQVTVNRIRVIQPLLESPNVRLTVQL